jgi:hypothetical protein
MIDFYGDLLGIRPGMLLCSRPLSSALKVEALFSSFVKPLLLIMHGLPLLPHAETDRMYRCCLPLRFISS